MQRAIYADGKEKHCFLGPHWSERLILAERLTDAISRMPTPPGKMKKTDHYVQWQQLKQLHKATYVGSYKPLVSRAVLCQCSGVGPSSLSSSLAQTSLPNLKLVRPKPAQTEAARWRGPDTTRIWLTDLCPCQWLAVFICILLRLCICVLTTRVCCLAAWLNRRGVICVIPHTRASDQSGVADSRPTGVGLIKRATSSSTNCD